MQIKFYIKLLGKINQTSFEELKKLQELKSYSHAAHMVKHCNNV